MTYRASGVVAVALLACAGCQRAPTSAPSAEGRAAARAEAAAATKPGAFPRQDLIDDARQLAEILEQTHPDPYINGGGKIAFHRRLHRVLNAIPQEGMTRKEFVRLIRPFVAGVGDAHTGILGTYGVSDERPGGVPLHLAVVDESLYVAGVQQQAHRPLLGARLVAVEEIPLAELLSRQARLRGIDNQYHGLQVLAEQSLRYRPHMEDLLPEWRDPRRVRVELEDQDGAVSVHEFVTGEPERPWIRPASRVTLPVPGDSGFRYAFQRGPAVPEELVYLRFTHMAGYRETRERRRPLATMIQRPPSATDTFRSMVTEMKQRRTRVLVVDVRGNHGGDSLIVDILVYFMYGKDALRTLHDFGTGETGVFRYSRLYFADRPGQSFERINAGRLVPLKEGDYEFSWSFEDGEPIATRVPPVAEPLGFELLRSTRTFRDEFEAGTHEGHYHPERVVVLCDAGTISAGFSVAVAFHRLGGVLVGTPSAQAPNSFGAATFWTLTHTGIRGQVPVVAATHFHDDPAKARVLPVDVPLTYERLASYGFDPNAEYLYALELLRTTGSGSAAY